MESSDLTDVQWERLGRPRGPVGMFRELLVSDPTALQNIQNAMLRMIDTDDDSGRSG